VHVQVHPAEGWVVLISQPTHSDISAADLAGVTWRRNRHSGQLGNCVQTAALPGEVAMGNSRHPDGPALIFSRDEMAAFLAGAKDGESDDYAG
jgi:hypothetical protein